VALVLPQYPTISFLIPLIKERPTADQLLLLFSFSSWQFRKFSGVVFYCCYDAPGARCAPRRHSESRGWRSWDFGVSRRNNKLHRDIALRKLSLRRLDRVCVNDLLCPCTPLLPSCFTTCHISRHL
jgi:hypothetical protein